MFLPIRTSMSLRSTPVVNYLLLMANIAVFLLTRRGLEAGAHNFYVLQASYPQLHQFLTHAFLHAGWAHLAGNMLFLYIFGNNINDRLGNVGYLAFYLAGAFFAGLGHAYMEQTPAVGASGAIAAVTGLYLILLARTRVTVLYWFFFIGTFEITALVWVLLHFGWDLWYSISDKPMQIAYFAHLAGYVFGFAVGLILLLAKLVERSNYDLFGFFSRVTYRYGPRQTVKQDFSDSQRETLSLRQNILDRLAAHDGPAAAELYLQLQRADPTSVLPVQAQLDLANQLMAQADYPNAAQAYELFLKSYPAYQQIGQVQLMLGLICARYLNRTEPARRHLSQALHSLPADSPAAQMCQTQLQRIPPLNRADPTAEPSS